MKWIRYCEGVKEGEESIGIVFQSRALDDILTGREHLEMHAAPTESGGYKETEDRGGP